jgi:hypothetical protein
MKAKIKQIACLVALLLLLVGCSTTAAKEGTPAPTATPPSQQVAEPAEPASGEREALVAQAVADLRARRGSVEVTVQEVVPVDFSDASLGVPEPGKSYAQVLTPGYIVRLAANGQEYEYHVADGRAVLASGGLGPSGEVTIEHVQVRPDALTVDGRSTFPDGTSVRLELLAGGQGAIWWPESASTTVQEGAWQITVPLDGVTLDPALDHVVYAWAEQDESSRVTFYFDLAGPPAEPAPPAQGETEYRRVEIADTGLSIDVPAGWLRLEPEWRWEPAEQSGLALGVRWVDLQPPQEAEPALLPKPSRVLDSQEVRQEWGTGRRVQLEVDATAGQEQGQKAPVASVETHVLVVVPQEGQRRAFDLYVQAVDAESLTALEPVLQHVLDTSTWAGSSEALPAQGQAPGGSEPPAGWSLFQDEVYGYRVAFPTDWAWKELPVQGPGMPDDWPVVHIVHLYPQAWDAQINRSDPPDPTAKPVVAPVQIEVVVGPPDQFRRVYPEPASSEVIEIGGLPVTVERETFDGMSVARYVFTPPDALELYVTVADQLTGFPERVAGNEAIADRVPQIAQSFQFGSQVE